MSGSPRLLPACFPLAFARLKITKKYHLVVMQATGVKEIEPILLVSRRPRNSILDRGEFGHGIVAKGLKP